MRENDLPKTSGIVTRRRFVTTALAGVSILGLSCIDISSKVVKDTPSLEVTPIPTPALNPIVATAGIQLQATAAVLKELQVDNSFHESSRFSREMFDKVKRSTVVLEIVRSNSLTIGTGWVAKTEGNNVYFATASHVMTTGE